MQIQPQLDNYLISPASDENKLFSPSCITTESMDEIFDHLDQTVTKNALVILDIDYTIRMPNNPALQMGIVGKKDNWAKVRETFKNMSEEENAVFKALYCMKTDPMLVDSELPKRIRSLQDRGIKMIALSSAFVGQVEKEGLTVEEFRYKDLKALGIDFSTSFSELKNKTFSQLEPFLGRHPVYHKGILLTNREKNDKGELLIAFLDYVKWTPNDIYVIDDMQHNIQAQEKALSDRNIKKYQTFLYKGALNHPEPNIAKNISQQSFNEAWDNLIDLTKKTTPELIQREREKAALNKV